MNDAEKAHRATMALRGIEDAHVAIHDARTTRFTDEQLADLEAAAHCLARVRFEVLNPGLPLPATLARPVDPEFG